MNVVLDRMRAALALGLATAGICWLVLASNPEVAHAETICIPNGDDTYTQTTGDPAPAPPGSIILDDGESCPQTEPTPPPEELPEPPECDPCPPEPPVEPEPPPTGAISPTGGESPAGAEPPDATGGEAVPAGTLVVSRDDPSFAGKSLPTTGTDASRLALVLAALALVAVAMRLAARRLSER